MEMAADGMPTMFRCSVRGNAVRYRYTAVARKYAAMVHRSVRRAGMLTADNAMAFGSHNA